MGARGLPRSDVQNAIDILGHDAVELSMTELPRWDPGSRSVTSLATSQEGDVDASTTRDVT